MGVLQAKAGDLRAQTPKMQRILHGRRALYGLYFTVKGEGKDPGAVYASWVSLFA